MENIEILMSVMNIKNESEFLEKIKEAKINNDVLMVNQVTENFSIFSINDNGKKLYSYRENGTSNSRNRLLEMASGDICIFADDDIIYFDNYEEIIKNAYNKNKKADGILFYVENKNVNREKNKKIGNKKLNSLDVMRARIYGLSLKKETIKKIKDKNIKFNKNFGPGGVFLKGEETIFIKELLDNGFKIYSTNKQIGYVHDKNSNWFTGFNDKYLFDQGAIFYKMFPKYYKLFIIQYLIRKYNLYKDNLNLSKAYTKMIDGKKYLEKIKKKNYC